MILFEILLEKGGVHFPSPRAFRIVPLTGRFPSEAAPKDNAEEDRHAGQRFVSPDRPDARHRGR